MLKVTVHLKSGTPITIRCGAYNDIVCETENICVYEPNCKWLFRKNEVEYIKIERNALNNGK